MIDNMFYKKEEGDGGVEPRDLVRMITDPSIPPRIQYSITYFNFLVCLIT